MSDNKQQASESPPVKLYGVRVFVDDWPLACDFYEHKLGLKAEFKSVEFSWAEYATGASKLCVEGYTDEGYENEATETGDHPGESAALLVGRFLGVILQVENIQDTYTELCDKGVEFTVPPEKQPWGGSLAHFKDPSGNILTLMSE